MSGTSEGGRKAAEKNKKFYGSDFYKIIGKLGGQTSTRTGFGLDKVGKDGLTGRERASVAGKKGGAVSKRSRKVESVYKEVMGRYETTND